MKYNRLEMDRSQKKMLKKAVLSFTLLKVDFVNACPFTTLHSVINFRSIINKSQFYNFFIQLYIC